MDLELSGETYRTGKLDCFKQLHVSRKIAPVILALGVGAKSLADLRKSVGLVGADEAPSASPEVAEVEQTVAMDILLPAIQPLVNALSKMPEEDLDYVLNACLHVCERKQTGGWQKVRINNRMVFEDVDMPVMMQLTIAVIKENIGGFFQGPPTTK